MGIFVRPDDDDLPERDARVIPFLQRRSLTASAQRVRLNDKDDVEKLQRRGRVAWQSRSWEYFDAIGEISFAFDMKASVVSRARIYPAFVPDPHQPPVALDDVGKGAEEDDPSTEEALPPDFIEAASAAMERITSTKGGVAGLLREIALNFDVAGECYLVQTPAKLGSGEAESWDIKSVDEIIVRGDGQVGIKPTRDAREKDIDFLPATAFVGRMWRSHPRYSGEAHSSMRGVLEPCADLLLFGRSNRAVARSRLNAGALYIPDGLSASAAPDDPELGEDETLPPVEDHDEFEEELILAMTTPIADEESASAIVPLLIRGPADLGDKIKHIKFERLFDQVLAERADRALERIMQGIDVPKDLVTGLANVKYCVPLDTEILTQRGWLRGDQVTADDIAYTMNHETGLGEWQPISQINVFDYDSGIDGPLYSHDQASFKSLSTADHRWPVIKTGPRVTGSRRRFSTSADLATTDRLQVSALAAEAPLEPKWQDAFAELVGWYTTEGSLVNHSLPDRRKYIQITQSITHNPVKVARIRRLLHSLYGPPAKSVPGTPSWVESTCHDGATAAFLLNDEAAAPLIEVAPGSEKIVSTEFLRELTPAQLQLFVEAAFEGDGSYFGDERGYSGSGVHAGILWQKSLGRLESIALACTLLGHPTRYYTKPDGSLHGIRLKKRSVIQPLRNPADRVEYKGQVWCPTTPNGTWLARREGTVYFTGNSNAVVINLNLYKAHIEPLLLLIVDALTFVWLRPALRAMGFDESLVNRVTAWYDPTDIIIQSDREAMADTGHDKNLVSDEAWRRAHGFSEADKPSMEELALKKVLQTGQVSPELTEAILQQMAPALFDAMRAQQQAQSGAPMPPEVAQAIGVAPSEAPVTPAPPPEAAPPIPPPSPTTAPPEPGTEAGAA